MESLPPAFAVVPSEALPYAIRALLVARSAMIQLQKAILGGIASFLAGSKRTAHGLVQGLVEAPQAVSGVASATAGATATIT